MVGAHSAQAAMDDEARDFSWDDAKSVDCLHRRGFDFGFAARLFDGPVVERKDGTLEMAEVRKTAAEIRAEGGGDVDWAKIDATTEAHFRQHIVEDGEDPDDDRPYMEPPALIRPRP